MSVQLASATAPISYTPHHSSYNVSDQAKLNKRINASYNNVCMSIPVINHVKSDADVGQTNSKSEKISLAKVIKLLSDPHSGNLIERHIEALHKITKHYADGFIMRELASVFRILNICADKISQNSIYIQPMLQLLGLCSLPFLQEKTSDQLTYEQIATECVDQLAYLMRVPDSDVRIQICDTLKKFCSYQQNTHYGKCQPTSYVYNQSLVEKSEVVQTLVQVLDFKDVNLQTKLAVVNLLRMLSHNSSQNCMKLLNVAGAERLCLHLMDSDPSLRLMFITVEVLWNILEYGDSDMAAEQLSNAPCISQLHSAFVDRVTQGFSSADKQLRNDLLTLCTLILSRSSTSIFIETGLTKQLAVFATFQEVKSHNVLVKHLKLTSDHEDFEFKKLLLNVLVLLGSIEAAVPVLSECRVLHALFTYIRCYESLPQSHSPTVWSPAQLEEIVLHAMSALGTLAPSMLTDYMECQGSTRLLVMLEWCVSESKYSGSGNGFHDSGSRGSKRAHLYRCIHIIHNIVSTQDETVLVDFIEQGLISQLTCLLEMFISERKSAVTRAEQSAEVSMSADLKLAARSADLESDFDFEIQTEILVTLSVLCQDENTRKEVFGKAGVDVLCEYLQTDTTHLNITHLRLLLAAVNTVWSAVIGCYSVEDYFLEKEGAFILMDLLEKCPDNLHAQLLGCLLDLLDNPRTLAHIQSWRGATDITPTQLLCKLWREEEDRMGVERDCHGVIADIGRPLDAGMLESQRQEVTVDDDASEAISDVLENIRAKIYSIFCRIGFVVEQGLSVEDHVTLVVIQHYLDLKTGEVWREVVSELSEDQVRPITPDREALEAITSAIQIRSTQIKELQDEIVDSHHHQDLSEEQKYYQLIRESHRQKNRAVELQREYMERTSKHMMLKAAKEKQNMAIDASRIHTGYAGLSSVRKTDVPNLNITTFCGRHVVIDHASKLNEQNDSSTSTTLSYSD